MTDVPTGSCKKVSESTGWSQGMISDPESASRGCQSKRQPPTPVIVRKHNDKLLSQDDIRQMMVAISGLSTRLDGIDMTLKELNKSVTEMRRLFPMVMSGTRGGEFMQTERRFDPQF